MTIPDNGVPLAKNLAVPTTWLGTDIRNMNVSIDCFFLYYHVLFHGNGLMLEALGKKGRSPWAGLNTGISTCATPAVPVLLVALYLAASISKVEKCNRNHTGTVLVASKVMQDCL